MLSLFSAGERSSWAWTCNLLWGRSLHQAPLGSNPSLPFTSCDLGKLLSLSGSQSPYKNETSTRPGTGMRPE